MFDTVYSPCFKVRTDSYRLVNKFFWLPKSLATTFGLNSHEELYLSKFKSKWLQRGMYYQKWIAGYNIWMDIGWVNYSWPSNFIERECEM